MLITGAFGRVYKGILTGEDGEKTEVAIKTLKGIMHCDVFCVTPKYALHAGA